MTVLSGFRFSFSFFCFRWWQVTSVCGGCERFLLELLHVVLLFLKFLLGSGFEVYCASSLISCMVSLTIGKSVVSATTTNNIHQIQSGLRVVLLLLKILSGLGFCSLLCVKFGFVHGVFNNGVFSVTTSNNIRQT